jgi:hypothetical protein
MEVKETDVDALLAKELNQMSFQERESVYEEIHGVEKEVDETDEFIGTSLEALENELQSIADKPAYDQAEKVDRGYVHSRKFRLMFLRSEYFHIQKTAIRLVKCMEGIRDYFGDGVLGRPLNMSDLEKDDLAYLKTGDYQILSERDSTGRIIVFDYHLSRKRLYKRNENLVSLFDWYV